MKAWLTYEMFEGKARPTEYGELGHGSSEQVASHTILFLDKKAAENMVLVGGGDCWLREIEIPDN
jgi:hypothetical protein